MLGIDFFESFVCAILSGEATVGCSAAWNAVHSCCFELNVCYGVINIQFLCCINSTCEIIPKVGNFRTLSRIDFQSCFFFCVCVCLLWSYRKPIVPVLPFVLLRFGVVGIERQQLSRWWSKGSPWALITLILQTPCQAMRYDDD